MATNFDSGQVSANTAATATQYNNLRKDVLQNAGDYASSTGSANAYLLSIDSQIAAYDEGQVFKFKANFTNTSAATLNVNSIGAKTIKKNNGSDDLAAGDIANGQIVNVIYDGTNLQLQSKPNIGDDVDVDLVAGETMDGTSSIVPVYLKASDGKLWKADSTSLVEAFYNYIGVIINSVTADIACALKRWGVVSCSTTLSQTVGSREITYSSAADSEISLTNASYWVSMGFYPALHQSNITSFKIYGKKHGTGGGVVTANLYAMASDGKATGASLGSATSDSSTWAAGGAEVTFTFGSPISLTQNATYGYVIKFTPASGTGVNFVGFFQQTGVNYIHDWKNRPSTPNWENTGSDTATSQFYFKYSYTGITYNPFDFVYINTTAGTLTPIMPTYAKIVGRIISASKIFLDENPSYKFLTSAISVSQNANKALKYVMPFGTNAVEAYISGTNSTKISAYTTFLTREKASTQTWKEESNANDLDLSISIDWTNGIITLPTSAVPSFSLTFYK